MIKKKSIIAFFVTLAICNLTSYVANAQKVPGAATPPKFSTEPALKKTNLDDTKLTPEEAINKFSDAINLVKSNYVDNPDFNKLSEDAIRGFLKDLDPHSVYLTAAEYAKSQEDLNGSFEGVGIQFNILEDTILVSSVILGGPSEKAGVMPGDKIINIEKEKVAGVKIDNDAVIKRLRGQKGSKVTIEVKRAGEKQLIPYAITRDKIPLFSVDASYMATPNTGYIKINKFASTTIREFEEAFDKLKQSGASNLILDLRGNGGGLLDVAFKLADEFLSTDKLIVYTNGLNSPKREYKATSEGVFEKGKLIVLIDEGSASASEILSGAVQDWDRGIVIGRRSFGKGLVQRPFQLNDGSWMRMTIARYYTPTGRSIQKPYDKGNDEYKKEVNDRYKKGELYSKDSIKLADSLKYTTLLKKRTVYGGGGIMPDIFVGLDTSQITQYYKDLNKKNIIYNYSLSYIDGKREELLSKYPDVLAFENAFDVNTILNDFFVYAEKKEVKKVEADIKISKPLIINNIKALIARNLYGLNAQVKINNQNNETYLKAIETLKNDDFKKMDIGMDK